MTRRFPCPACGYPLHGLLGGWRGTCPECGRQLTVDDIARFNPERAPRWWVMALLGTPLVMAVAAVGVAILDRRGIGAAELLSPLALGFLWATVAAWQLLNRWTREDPRPVVRWMLLPLSIILAMMVTALSAGAVYAVLALLGILW